jgi:RNA polymerase sigma-70 factor, ECF subfamily
VTRVLDMMVAMFGSGDRAEQGLGGPGAGKATRGRSSGAGGKDDDEGLVERSKRGDRDAFAELARRHEGRVFGVVYQYVKNEDDAEDITREVLIKAFRSITRFRGTARFSSWLCRIAINKSIDFIRRRKNVRIEQLDDPVQTDSGELSRDFPDTALTPDEEVENRELGARIGEAIEQLSPKLKTVILLREIEGLSIKEIAETLRCSSGTVKSRIFRARERLQALLAPYVEA